jgi:glutathione S-transferase
MNDPLKLVGGMGSPYSRKMRAVLRYRRIPFRWIRRGAAEDLGIPPVRVPLIPVIVFPGEDVAHTDSTPLIRRLEERYAERRVLPPDPALAFLDALIEDYADEWLTKAMFHYRWAFAPDVHKSSHVLPLDRDVTLHGDALARQARMFAERQVGRLAVVGSSPETAPIIESSYRRLLERLDAILCLRPFVMGERPGAGDFGLFGQLSQLVLFDPTSMAIAVEETPRVYAWTQRVDDLGALEVDDKGWLSREAIGPELRALFEEIGRVYTPFLLANAAALASGAEEVRCEIDGHPYRQRPFRYQGKCLSVLRESYAALDRTDRSVVDRTLSGTGCEALCGAAGGVG